MTKTLSTAVLAILAALFLLLLIPPAGTEAAAQTPTRAGPSTAADEAWPAPQEPLDTTPITPVESAGAPMHESF
ncbi:hypothetical protein [Aquabacterium sp.]|uniref:hypothetical protein n=1 Tax=Aquabacterium sp. TaxID=1872578 RepID=UPI002C2A5A25|nr:hypothetical protein [Aquabacterium sp.]HSW04106.1 hypothetical protein [Aquabacterium sp.]